MIKLALVDDHQLFREGLRALLASYEDLSVVGEAATAREACAVVAAAQPDVVVLDVTLPGTDGIAVTRDLRRLAPAARVLVLTMHASEAYAAEALEAGATGYALKDQPAPVIVDAIRAVAAGTRYVAPRLLRDDEHAGDEASAGAAAQPSGRGILARLSAREREVFRLAVRGFSNQAIADELRISVKTVETHRAKINRKLGAHSAADLVRVAAHHNLLER